MNLGWYYNTIGENRIPFLQLNEPYRVTDYNLSGQISEEESMEWFNATLEELRGVVHPDDSRLSLEKLILDNGGILEVEDKTGNKMELVVDSVKGTPLTWETHGTGRNIAGRIRFTYDGEVLGYHADRQNTTNQSYVTIIFIRDYTDAMRLINLGYVNEWNAPPTPTARGDSFNNMMSELPAELWYLFPDTLDEPIVKEEGIVSMNDRYAPRTGANGIGVYPLTQLQVGEFTSDLWTKTLWEAISEFVNGSPMESIISLRWFYGIKADLPVSDDNYYVTLGSTPFNGLLTESSIVSRPVASELVTYSLGHVEVPRKYNNFLDLEPFTKMQLYIPYVGYVNLNTTEFIGKRIRLEYNINLVTGATVALVYVNTGENSWRVMSEYPTVTGVEIPLTINSRESINLRMATTLAGIGATGAGAALGSVAGPMGAAVGASVGHNLAGSALDSFSNGISSMSNPGGGAASRNGGGMDGETGSLSDFTPHVLLSRPQAIAPPEYNDNIGRPDFRNVVINNMSGYFKIAAFKKRNDNSEAFSDAIPREAFNEIEQILRTGVYMQ